jgi:hypothetical protein
MRVEYLWVACATLVYLLVDIYPSVKSLSAILRTASFWILWLLFCVLNVIAWGALRLAAQEQIYNKLHDQTLTNIVIIILATLCTLTILQSFTLKIGDYKFVDVSLFLENFRKTVLQAIGEQLAQGAKRQQQRCADKLFAKYSNNRKALRDAYAGIMSFGGRTLKDIGQDLLTLEQEAINANLSFERELASRIAKADLPRAKELVSAP